MSRIVLAQPPSIVRKETDFSSDVYTRCHGSSTNRYFDPHFRLLGLACSYTLVASLHTPSTRDRRKPSFGKKHHQSVDCESVDVKLAQQHSKYLQPLNQMRNLLLVACAVTLVGSTQAFVPQQRIGRSERITPLAVAGVPPNELDTRSFLLSREEINPIITFGKDDKEKIINPFGLWCLFVSLVTGPIWMLAMKIVHKMENDENRALYDMTGKIWSKTWLTMTNSYPTVSGNMERLKAGNDAGACLFVANHASWLDIPVLCTVLDPVFKFIAKGELSKVPCIGAQLSGGEHILIDREDRRSQLKTFKEGINYLKNGVPIMAFPEGQRSKDGRLMEFKGGLFAMAAKTNVPIVPITLSHTHSVMPSNALFPVQPGAGKLHVHVHDAIDTTGKTEEELVALVRESFLKTLPLEQHPLEHILSTEELQALSELQHTVQTTTLPTASATTTTNTTVPV